MDRKKSMKKYSLTAAHRAQLKPWVDKWIANAMSTKPMDDTDRAVTREAMKGLYRAAELEPPPDHRIVFVSSPFVLRFSAGFASAIWWLRKKNAATRLATDAATRLATDAATRLATDAATRLATGAATRLATGAAMNAATLNATDAATRLATDAATNEATDEATREAMRAAMNDATFEATFEATRAATREATRDATLNATDAATRLATDAATFEATLNATRDATRAATRAAAATLNATDAATRLATDAATFEATLNATLDATREATREATNAATRLATDAATRLATDAATRLATDAATRLATDAAMNDATRNAWWRTGDFKAVALGLLKRHAIFGLRCANEIYRLWQGGNQWSAYDSYISFFRNIAKLEIDYSRWAHWEAASLHGGPRIMHEKFCMISDRPRDLTVDDQNRPHNATGPFCKWSDGSSLFAWHGTRMPARYYFEEPTAVEILAERNVEVRRCLIERYDELNGRGSFMRACGAKVLDSSVQPMHVGCTEMLNELLAIELPDDPEGRMVALRVVCPSTAREYIIRVPPDQTTVLGALAWTFDMKPSEYRLAQET